MLRNTLAWLKCESEKCKCYDQDVPFDSEYQEDNLKSHERALRIANSYKIPLNDENTNFIKIKYFVTKMLHLIHDVKKITQNDTSEH